MTDWLDEFGQEEKIQIVDVRSGNDDWLAAFDAEAEKPSLMAARSVSPRALDAFPDETAPPTVLRGLVENPLVVVAALFWVCVVATVVAVLRPGAFEVAPATNYSAAATPPEPQPRGSVPFLEEILGFRTTFGSASFGTRTDAPARASLPTTRGVATAGATFARAVSPLRNRTAPVTLITPVAEPPRPLITLDQTTFPAVAQPLPLITLPNEPVAMRAANVSIELPPVAVSPAPAPAPDPGLKDRSAIQSVLGRYRQAFDTLDASGVESFWPSVNPRSLARVFDQLQEQSFRFDSCDIDVSGDRADAACAGTASYVPKVGGKNTREESRRWTFRLQRGGAGWIIDRVESRVGNAPR